MTRSNKGPEHGDSGNKNVGMGVVKKWDKMQYGYNSTIWILEKNGQVRQLAEWKKLKEMPKKWNPISIPKQCIFCSKIDYFFHECRHSRHGRNNHTTIPTIIDQT